MGIVKSVILGDSSEERIDIERRRQITQRQRQNALRSTNAQVHARNINTYQTSTSAKQETKFQQRSYDYFASQASKHRSNYQEKQQSTLYRPTTATTSTNPIRNTNRETVVTPIQRQPTRPVYARPVIRESEEITSRLGSRNRDLEQTSTRPVYRQRQERITPPVYQETMRSQTSCQVYRERKTPHSMRVNRYQQQQQQEEDNYKQLQDNSQYQEQLRKHILSFHKGNHHGNIYHLDQRLKIYPNFRSQQKYIKTLKELIKYQILSDVTKRLQEKEEEKYQRQIKVKVSKGFMDKVKSSNPKYDVYKEWYDITADVSDKDGGNSNSLEECLLKGQRLGILTATIPFKIEHFVKVPNTFLCFLREQRVQKKKLQILSGIHKEDIPSSMYFIDLDSIISSVRQYLAIIHVEQSPLLEKLLGNRLPRQQREVVKRDYLLSTIIFNQIKEVRNESQIGIVQKMSQEYSGIFLIQGPPGTGKTQTITNYISLQLEHAIKEKQVIMVCSQSNAAINHIVRKIHDKGLIGSSRSPKMLRLGSTQQYDQILLEYNLSHQCQIRLLRSIGEANRTPSAKLRFQKLGKWDQINKLMGKVNYQNKSRQLKKEVKKIIKELVELKAIINSNYPQYCKIEDQMLKECQIVLSTLNTSGKSKYLKYFTGRVQCLIIDQAGQATQPSTLIPLQTSSKKVLLVGDHKQLPPTVMSQNARKTKLNRSLFERMIDNGDKPSLLDTQYRMLPQLSDFPSKSFYSGDLKNGGKHTIPNSLIFMRSPSWFIDIAYGQEQCFKKSQQNKHEAQAIFFLIRQLISADKSLSIGVIAPYKSQIKLIDTLIEDLNYDQNKLKVSTVDAFQGQERDVIIMTCVRANKNSSIGFVKCEKRMNVSITRAKYALFVFGHKKTLNGFSKGTHWQGYLGEHHRKKTLISTENLPETRTAIKDILSTQI